MGRVNRGALIDLAQAVAERQAGRDVVVCGPQLVPNMQVAQQIESLATGPNPLFHASHAGKLSLSHFQSRASRYSGHTFFEAPPLKTAK